ncbi:LysR substrate-binding domain-containing protein [Georgenia sp. Z1344]|uniref:LysR substrate-binding domain-containing protein n=1 Tax=Georgenia sp. Z1344 TaxID=3416706 RepID=UPI003CEB238B
MPSEIDDLELVQVVAAAGTLTGAARHWGMSISAVSRRLRALEQRLGTTLAHRRARGLELTPEGRRYAERAAELLQEVRDLEDSLRPGPDRIAGPLRVVSTVGLGRSHVAPLLRELQAEHPGLDVRLELSSLPLGASLPGFDLAVRVGRVPDSTLELHLLLPNRRIVVASPAYLERHGTPRTVEDLAHHECLVVLEDEGSSTWELEVGGAPVAVPVDGHLTCTDGTAVTQWCLDGAGLAMRSTWDVGRHVRSGALVQVLADVPTPDAHVVALHDGGGRAPARVHAAVEHLRAGLARRCDPAAVP